MWRSGDMADLKSWPSWLCWLAYELRIPGDEGEWVADKWLAAEWSDTKSFISKVSKVWALSHSTPMCPVKVSLRKTLNDFQPIYCDSVLKQSANQLTHIKCRRGCVTRLHLLLLECRHAMWNHTLGWFCVNKQSWHNVSTIEDSLCEKGLRDLILINHSKRHVKLMSSLHGNVVHWYAKSALHYHTTIMQHWQK